MKTIRRLYFYLVSLICLEVVIWGLINLLRTIFSSGLTFPGADTLAQALALIFVGVPIFAVHWLWAQRASSRDPEENSAALRAIFFYAVLLITLIPVVQNILALVNRTVIVSVGMDSLRSFVGGAQTWVDNTIAIFLNLIAASYFYRTLNINWKELSEKENFSGIRRLYRYLWVLYGLLMTIFGIQQSIRFIFYLPNNIIGSDAREMLINGLALVLVGTPVWVYTWSMCQNAISEPGEGKSVLRLIILFILAMSSVLVVLTTSGLIIDVILLQILGAKLLLKDFIMKFGDPFSVGVPFAVVWAYYGGWLNREIRSYEDETRRAALKRFYYYILSFTGLTAAFIGLTLLMSFIVSIATSNALWGDVLRPQLAGAIATLFAGLPLWYTTWRPMQDEALQAGDGGDHARRSLIRRAYLYLAIFSTVIGGMASAIYLVYTVLFGFLGQRSDNFITDVLNGLQLLLLFAAFLVYHLSVMKKDGTQTADTLAIQQGSFPVLIFENLGSGFSTPYLEAIKHASLAIPAAVQQVENGIPEGNSEIKAVILPSTLASDPPEALRLWLKNFNGAKIIVPVNQPGWYWSGGIQKNNPQLTTQILRQLAEGQEVRSTTGTSTVMIVAYVFAGLFGLQVLFMLLGLGISLITNP